MAIQNFGLCMLIIIPTNVGIISCMAMYVMPRECAAIVYVATVYTQLYTYILEMQQYIDISPYRDTLSQ